MRGVIVLLMAGTLWMVSCKNENIEADKPSVNALQASNLLGQWRFKGYSDGIAPKYDVSMEIKNEENKLAINGRSSVNFYFAEPEIDETKRTMKVPALGTTKIAGTIEATTFEMNYYESLKRVERYDFKERNILVLYLSSPANEVLYFEKK